MAFKTACAFVENIRIYNPRFMSVRQESKTARSDPRSTFDLRNLTVVFGRNADESTYYSSDLSESNFPELFQHHSAALSLHFLTKEAV